MKRLFTISIITLAIALTISILNSDLTSSAKPLPPGQPLAQAVAAYGKIPLSFERNDGQTDAAVKFLSRGAGYALFLTEAEAVLRLKADNCKSDEKSCERRSGVLRIGFDGANGRPQVSGVSELDGKSNYLELDGTGRAITNVPTFERVQYKEVYAGIDLVFYGNERQLEYDFNVRPHADPSQITLNFAGMEKLALDERGDLIATVVGKDLKFTAPVAYQTVNGERREVAASYVVEGRSKIGFALGEYLESETLVIDPILQYSSYLGGDGRDTAGAIIVNAAGEAYIAGDTASANFPTAGAIQPSLNGPSDAFLTKFNASGTGVIFSTYLGGPAGQSIDGLALDASGNIALSGTDERNVLDVFVGRLNPGGSALVHPTVFIGGSDSDQAEGIDLDGAGNTYVTGRTNSTNFPTTPGVIQPNDGPGVGAFAVRVNANGVIGYSTYLDGPEDNQGSDVAVDGAGNAYVTGSHVTTTNAAEVFILKLNPTGSALVYPTFYFGGSNTDTPSDIEIDDAGNAYIGGSTFSDNFPTTAGVVQPVFGGNTMFLDGFAAKVNAAGNSLVWATYLGSTSSENVRSLKLDHAGGLYVTGNLLPTGDSNYYVVHLNSTASAVDYNAQFGGTGFDFVEAMTVGPNDDIYLAGAATSSDFPTTVGAFDRTYNTNTDGFIMKIAGPQAPGSTVLNVNVPGNAVLNNERFIVRLNAGDQVTVTNISGQVNFDTIDNVPGCTYLVNANGLSRDVYNTNQVGCYNNEWTANDPLPGANQGHAGLYMMRGAQKTFIGLAGATFTAAADQDFYLGVNDVPFTGGPGGGAPNTGSFNARITITQSSSQTLVTNVTVAGTTVGVNGGVTSPQVTIQPGDLVKIEATGGTVNFNDGPCSAGTYAVGPGGTNLNPTDACTADDTNPALCNLPSAQPMPGRNHAGLFRPAQAGMSSIKWIGNNTDTFTYAGTLNTVLRLGVNDISCAVSPNSGAFNVRATITRPSTTTLNINVPGNAVPNAEKFVAHLTAGDEVTINNISGQVDFDPLFTADCTHVVNANGLDREVYNEPVNRLCWLGEWTPNDPLQGANHGHAGLYMMRGAAKTFIGLNGSTFTATADQPLYLGVNDGGTSPNTGSFNTRVTINRAAKVEPTLSVSTVTLQEGNAGTTNAVFTVSLTPASDDTVTVRTQTANGTAVAGQDYAAGGGPLTFAPGETSKTVSVAVIGDQADEPNEYFTLQLINPTGAQTVVPRGRANITDDDAVPSIVVGDAGVSEGNSATVNANFGVSLSGVSGNTVTVNYATSNGTASAPSDYTAKSGTLTFAPGEISKPLPVAVVGDTLVEGNETFNLTLSAPSNATISDGTGVGTISNDDVGGTVQFALANVSVSESAGTATITVNRTGGAASGVTVNFATSNGTATAGQDYTAISGPITFGAGEASKTVIIAITSDTFDEANETVNLSLSAPTGGATLGSPSFAVLTITDDDTAGTVQFAQADFPIGESAGNATVTVTRADGAASGVTVNYATSNGTATAGQDYTPRNGSLVFGAGETSKTFTIPITSDTLDENAETITIALTGPGGGAALGSPATATVTIVDDDNSTATRFDYDGDHKADISVFRPSTGAWYLNGSQAGISGVTWGVSTDIITPADYDGDGRTDVAVFRPAEGRWYILNSSTSSFTTTLWGTNGDTPAPADYDGDGRADLSIFRPSTGSWWISPTTAGATSISFGQNGDVPAACDYDGDGKSDIGIFRPSTGIWYLRRSLAGDLAYQFGLSSDKIAPADYDGDGKADIAVYRPSIGTWYIAYTATPAFASVGFGGPGDIPVAADYDGDGKADVAIYRPSGGSWWLNQSQAGPAVTNFGQNGDKPTPNAFGN